MENKRKAEELMKNLTGGSRTRTWQALIDTDCLNGLATFTEHCADSGVRPNIQTDNCCQATLDHCHVSSHRVIYEGNTQAPQCGQLFRESSKRHGVEIMQIVITPSRIERGKHFACASELRFVRQPRFGLSWANSGPAFRAAVTQLTRGTNHFFREAQ